MFAEEEAYAAPAANLNISGAEGDRTPDLLNAIQALSQLSYGPNIFARKILNEQNTISKPHVFVNSKNDRKPHFESG